MNLTRGPLRRSLCAALSLALVATAAAGERAMRLSYLDQEPGTDPYRSRILVTAPYLRIDHGPGDGDFILLDRARGTVYSTNRADGSVLVIQQRPRAVQPPWPLRLASRLEPLPDAPRIDDRATEHRVYRANGRRCYEVISVPGLFPDAVSALAEYRRVLASEHLRLLSSMPPELHEACDLARNVFSPGWYLEHGLPVAEWDGQGRRRELLDYDPAFPVEPALFRIPEGLRRYRLDPDAGEPQ